MPLSSLTIRSLFLIFDSLATDNNWKSHKGQTAETLTKHKFFGPLAM